MAYDLRISSLCATSISFSVGIVSKSSVVNRQMEILFKAILKRNFPLDKNLNFSFHFHCTYKANIIIISPRSFTFNYHMINAINIQMVAVIIIIVCYMYKCRFLCNYVPTRELSYSLWL